MKKILIMLWIGIFVFWGIIFVNKYSFEKNFDYGLMNGYAFFGSDIFFQTVADIENDVEKINSSSNNSDEKNQISKEKNNKNFNEQESNKGKNENNNQSKKIEQKDVASSEKVASDVKKLNEEEVKEYLKKNHPDFHYDFGSASRCTEEGNKWSEYGWFYNCTFIRVPNTDIVPYMLTISTGKFFCDGAYTKNEKYYWDNPKISSIAYLRKIGYPCENIQGEN